MGKGLHRILVWLGTGNNQFELTSVLRGKLSTNRFHIFPGMDRFPPLLPLFRKQHCVWELPYENPMISSPYC